MSNLSDDVATAPGAKRTADDVKPTPAEAKARLMDVARSIDLLAPMRDHPFVVVGAAATVGAVLGSSGSAINGLTGLTSTLIKLINPLSGIIAQIVAAKVASDTATEVAKDEAAAPMDASSTEVPT